MIPHLFCCDNLKGMIYFEIRTSNPPFYGGFNHIVWPVKNKCSLFGILLKRAA